MKSLFRYPGGKTKLIPQILPFLEKTLSKSEGFCDAFVGGGSVLLEVAEKYPSMNLSCNDKDWFVYCFWQIVSSDSTMHLDALKRMVEQKPTIELFYKLRNSNPTNMAEAAYRAIFFNRTSFSGDMRRGASPIGGRKQQSKYTVDCRYNAQKIIAKIDAINKLLVGRTWVSNEDINSYEVLQDKSITIYLDPPYWHKGKMLYQEYMKNDEHIELSNLLKSRNNWILSYDNCKEIIDLYDWASVHFIDAAYCIRGSKTNWQKTKEVLIVPNLSADQG